MLMSADDDKSEMYGHDMDWTLNYVDTMMILMMMMEQIEHDIQIMTA